MGLLYRKGSRAAPAQKIEKELTVVNRLGLHARPAAMFVRIASRHRAGSDALATAEIFLFLLTKLEEDHGVKDLVTARTFQFPEIKPATPSDQTELSLVPSL